uniref:Uncharacterized protein n=1 Tax=Anopheles atroparvus TaxID=41427 RepID=A0AAG5D3K6_ANOAO
KGGPLSLCRIRGRPQTANILHKAELVLFASVLRTSRICRYREYVSTLRINSPVPQPCNDRKSICIISHGPSGNSRLDSGIGGFFRDIAMHVSQLFTKLSASFDILGHQKN